MKKILWFFTKLIFGLPLMLLFPVKVIGRENLPKKRRYLSISNHYSVKDVILLGVNLRGFRHFLAKKELSKNPFIRLFFKAYGAIFIDRNKLDMRGFKTAINSLEKANLSIFPEGTRNRENDELQQVKGGAALIAVKANAPVVPIMIHHKSKVFRKNYIYIAPSLELPYNNKDRFNSDAMRECTEIIGASMQGAKDFLDKLVKEKGFKEYKKQIKAKKQQTK